MIGVIIFILLFAELSHSLLTKGYEPFATLKRNKLIGLFTFDEGRFNSVPLDYSSAQTDSR